MAENAPVRLNRIERVLATMIATVAGLSILAMIAIVIATLTATKTSDGLWPTIAVLPGIGLPLAFLLIVVFSVLAIVRRRRIANGGG